MKLSFSTYLLRETAEVSYEFSERKDSTESSKFQENMGLALVITFVYFSDTNGQQFQKENEKGTHKLYCKSARAVSQNIEL